MFLEIIFKKMSVLMRDNYLEFVNSDRFLVKVSLIWLIIYDRERSNVRKM